MLLPDDASNSDASSIDGQIFDAVIVGSGISGAIIAKQLAAAGKSVLILEAGVGERYEDLLARFYGTAS